MTLQTSGAISLSDIQTEFGGANPIGLNEYYAGGGLVPSGTTGTNGAVPSSGEINFWNFYGTAAAAAAATYWMSMLTINSVQTEDNYGQSIAVDGHGNVYITGYETTQTAGYNDIFIAKYNTSGVIQWQRRLGGTDYDYGQAIAVDGSGNVYIAGYEASQTAGNYDIFIAKYSTSGVIQWQRRLGGTSTDGGAGIAVDGSGNVYIAGYEYSQTAGNYDVFIAKYNTSGVIQWQRSLGGTSTDYGQAIAVDGSGNVYVTGYEVQTAGNYDVFIAKYNTSGVIQWQRRLGGTGADYGTSIAVDGSGNVYVTGYETTQTAGSNDVFIAKYNTSGVIQWQRRLGGTNNDRGSGIAVDGSGNVYVTGYEYSQSGGVNYDIFVAKYNTSGVIQWQRRVYSSTHDLYGTSIVVNGTTFSVCGYYQSSPTHAYVAVGSNSFIASLPIDGTKTGSSVTFSQVYATPVLQYAATTLTDAATTLTDAATTLTDAATTLTDAATTLTDAATTYTAETHTI
jgi:uncharacterized delta-60 repeat protein